MKKQSEPALPDYFTAFKVKLVRQTAASYPWYRGKDRGMEIDLWQLEDKTWATKLRIDTALIAPDLTSSSPRAALTNLRGHARRLAYALDKNGIKP